MVEWQGPRLIANRYRVIEELGKGGFGVVYRASDTRLGREVAIKLFNNVMEPGAEDRIRFEREALILASLDHPNIVPLFDAGIDERAPYFAMKLVRGNSLAKRIATSSLGAPEALAVLAQISAALEHAHSRGILHRDIKPSNVLLDEEGRAWLADFGVSSAGFLPRLTRQGTVVGTLLYLAPEALSGETSVRADLYSLGTVLYEMLFGLACFPQTEPSRLVQAICSDTPELLRTPPAGIHPEILTLLRALLAKLPEQRPVSAKAVSETAERIRSSLGDPTIAQTIISVDSAAVEVDPADVIDRLEKETAEIARLCQTTPDDLDSIVDHLTTFVREAVAAGDVLLHAQRVDDGVRHALALSLLHMTREVERQVQRSQPAREGTSPFSAPLFRLQKTVNLPVGALITELQRRDAAPEAISDFFHFDEPVAAAGKIDAECIDKLRSADELTRHEAVLEIASGDIESFAAALRQQTPAIRNELLEVLWQHADLLLLEARGRSRPIFETATSMAGDDLRLRWQDLYSLFRRSEADLAGIRGSITARTQAQQKVFGRCLLLHPDARWRQLAFDLLDANDFWEVIASPSTSVQRLTETWRHLRPRAGTDFQKIFLACARDTLMRRGEAERIVAAIDLVKDFYETDVFHEDVFFRMLVELDEWVRAEARRHHLLVDFDAQYVERFREFLARGVRKEQPIEGWGQVPLPIQRRLARAGHFIRHFACHPIEAIALECAPHIAALGNGMSFAVMPSINAKLLAAIAKEKHLWMTDEARFALVANPKTPPPIVLKYIGYLRRDLLTRLASSHECNSLARATAERMLARRT